MNFAVTRAELVSLTGIKRTKTFALQKTGQLRATSTFACKTWFSIEEALNCAAIVQGVGPPDKECIEAHTMAVIQLRLSCEAKCK